MNSWAQRPAGLCTKLNSARTTEPPCSWHSRWPVLWLTKAFRAHHLEVHPEIAKIEPSRAPLMGAIAEGLASGIRTGWPGGTAASEPPDQWPIRDLRHHEECRRFCASSGADAAQITRFGQADHGVHVGTIEVHLTAGRMHHVQTSDGRFKNTVREVRDHQCGQVVTMFGNFGFKISHQVTTFITLQGTTVMPPSLQKQGWCHGRGGHQADISVRLVAGLVVARWSSTLRTLLEHLRWLQTDPSKTRDFRQRPFEIGQKLFPTFGLRFRCEGVHGENSGQETGSISEAALSFMVHEPRESSNGKGEVP